MTRTEHVEVDDQEELLTDRNPKSPVIRNKQNQQKKADQQLHMTDQGQRREWIRTPAKNNQKVHCVLDVNQQVYDFKVIRLRLQKTLLFLTIRFFLGIPSIIFKINLRKTFFFLGLFIFSGLINEILIKAIISSCFFVHAACILFLAVFVTNIFLLDLKALLRLFL